MNLSIRHFALLCFAVICGANALAVEPRPIQDFMEVEEKWPQLAKTSTRWHLEGRYAFLGKTEMRFTKCPLRFLLPPGTVLNTKGAKVVEVAGYLEEQDKEIVFVIENIATYPDGEEQLRLRRAGVNPSRPEGWYELADWVSRRGTFYSDETLLGKATELRQNGIALERTALDSDDYKGLLELAQKALNFGLSTEFAREMQHAAYRRQYEIALRPKQNTNIDELTSLLKKQLKGGAKHLAAVDPDVQKDYLEDPLTVYANGNAAKRDIYDRLFVIDLELARIQRDAKEDGSNGEEIAERIETFLPEYPELAEQYRKMELDYLVSRVGRMTRQEMLDLGKKFEAREEPDRVAEVRRDWLTALEPRMRRDRGRGLCNLAEDWITLLSDKEKAVELYIEAYKIDPGYPVSTRWLEENGYVLYGGKWIPEDEAPVRMETVIDTAMREGRVIEGMTVEQVLTALGTEPTTKLQLPSSRGLTQVFVYGDSGLTIRFFRRTHLDESKVVAIGQAAGKRARKREADPQPPVPDSGR
ncbi:MAG: hypothetical protein KDA66_09160 [Planctomycetaceae bacterium]|nr:hypothetical protein [Planctomycetaceae bacterium]